MPLGVVWLTLQTVTRKTAVDLSPCTCARTCCVLSALEQAANCYGAEHVCLSWLLHAGLTRAYRSPPALAASVVSAAAAV